MRWRSASSREASGADRPVARTLYDIAQGFGGWQQTCAPFFTRVLRTGSTAEFRELERFIEDHRSCGTLTIHAPDCQSALGFLILLNCECGDGVVRWISVEAAFEEVIDSPWPATSN